MPTTKRLKKPDPKHCGNCGLVANCEYDTTKVCVRSLDGGRDESDSVEVKE